MQGVRVAVAAAVVVTSGALAGCAVDDFVSAKPDREVLTALVPRQASGPATAEPVADPQEIVYEAQLLDGSTALIRSGDGTVSSFTGDVPSAIHALNLLAERNDCDGIRLTTDLWLAVLEESDDVAVSAFARHGENLEAFLGCD